jgi:predicted amidohydrolase YtcJ
MPSPCVFTGGVVRTMVAGDKPAQALAWADGRILSIGTDQQVAVEAGQNATVIDLGGRTLVPGFIDAHHHVAGTVIDGGAVDCTAAQAPSISAIIERLRAAAGDAPPDQWLVGVGYDELSLAEQRHPTRSDLDGIGTKRPVLLHHYTYHEGVLSSAGLAAAGIDRHTRAPRAGVIEQDRAGEPTGRVIETAFSKAAKLAQDSFLRAHGDAFVAGLEAYQHQLFRVGITRVCDPLVPAEVEALYREAHQQQRLHIPMVLLPGSSTGNLSAPWDRLDGPTTGDGPEELRLGHLKVFLDGATRCAISMTLGQTGRAALKALQLAWQARSLNALHEAGDMSFRLDRDLRVRSGVRYLSREQSRALTAQAYDRGFAVAFHAIGNAAVAQAIDAFAHLGRRHEEMPPPRIEHATLVDVDMAKRAADLGICMVSQPFFLELPVFQNIPVPPGLRLLAHRTMIDAGVRVAGSSDAPVTGFDPLAALGSAVTRRTAAGQLLQPEEAISPAEALAMYTREAAYATDSLAVCGTLEPGKRADLVVLNADPCASEGSPAALAALQVDRTIVGGETVYDAGAF